MDENSENPYESPSPADPAGAHPLTTTADERQWAMFCHLSGLAGYVIPLGNVIGPLIIWQVKKDEFPLVDDQGREALNFQISMMIYIFIGVATICIGVGIVILAVVGVLDIVFLIIAALKANQGERYRYPFIIRLI